MSKVFQKPVAGRCSAGALILSAVAVAAVLFYAWGLFAFYGKTNGWLIDDTGLPRTNEFAGVRAAGELALAHQPAAVYDWSSHEAQLAQLTGRPVVQYFPFPYPPHYLPVAMLLALPPYVIAAIAWILATAALYMSAAARIAGIRRMGLWAIACPASAFNAFVAHTAFWTAGISGLALWWIVERPLLSGLAIAAMTCKPQLVVLLPFALVAGRHWQTLFVAAVATLGLVAVSMLLFGVGPWHEFAIQTARIGEAVRSGQSRLGPINYNLLVTTYGFLRALGVDDGLAMIVQAVVSAGAVIYVALLWRSSAPMPLKAAGLMTASLLATPYLFIYDLTQLGIALAFMVAYLRPVGFRAAEVAALAVSLVLIMLPAFLPLPLAYLASLYVALVVAGHARPFVRSAVVAISADLPWGPAPQR